MAFINIEIDSADSIGQLNDLLQASGNPQEGVQALLNYLNKGTRQVTVPMNKYGQSKYDTFSTPQNLEDTNINRAFNQGIAGFRC